MFASVIAAWNGTMAVTKKVLDRLWGEQTSQESSLMKRAEHAELEYRSAAQRLREANASGNDKAKAEALTATNSWRAELNRLRDEAAAKRT
jgi:hypothetical protein